MSSALHLYPHTLKITPPFPRLRIISMAFTTQELRFRQQKESAGQTPAHTSVEKSAVTRQPTRALPRHPAGTARCHLPRSRGAARPPRCPCVFFGGWSRGCCSRSLFLRKDIYCTNQRGKARPKRAVTLWKPWLLAHGKHSSGVKWDTSLCRVSEFFAHL